MLNRVHLLLLQDFLETIIRACCGYYQTLFHCCTDRRSCLVATAIAECNIKPVAALAYLTLRKDTSVYCNSIYMPTPERKRDGATMFTRKTRRNVYIARYESVTFITSFVFFFAFLSWYSMMVELIVIMSIITELAMTTTLFIKIS